MSTNYSKDKNNDKIIGTDVSKTPNKSVLDVIEVEETPEVSEKQTKDCVNYDLNDSPITVSKRCKRRIISDDEDFDDKNNKRQNTGLGSTDDEIGKTAFEDMCETSIKELQSLFPEIEICEVQDALIESNWSVFNASIKLGNLSNGNDEDIGVVFDSNTDSKTNGTTGLDNSSGNNEKMKSFDYYRSKSLNKSNESMASSSKAYFNSINSNRNKFKSFVKNKREDKEEIILSDQDSDEEYNRDDIVGLSSDEEDSEDDSKTFKNKGPKVMVKVQDLRAKVVSHLQNSNSYELNSIAGVSGKKIELIINLRPFTDWDDVITKFKTYSLLSTDLLNNCCETLKARDTVEKLMDSCEDITKQLSQTVETLKPLDHPKTLNKDMKLSHYQLIGLNWLALMHKKQLNCILADEMGLGKTIQVIAFFAYLREMKNITGQHLIVVPSSTLDNWSREFQTWCPEIKLLLYYGSQEDREDLRQRIFQGEFEFDVLLTTYNLTLSTGDRMLFKRKFFKYVVFDEAHYLKNMKSSRFEGLMKIKAKHRLLLTGTPLQNNLVELMSLLIFTMPHMFSGKTDQVKALFTYTNKDPGSERNSFIKERIQHAKKIMKPFVLRRLKSEVLRELPLKIDQKVFCRMTDNQELKYMELIENYSREIKYRKITFEDNEPEEKFARGTGMLTNLRKMANHPLLVRDHYNDDILKKMSALMLKESTHKDANKHLILEDMQVMHDFELHALCKKYRSIYSYKLDDEVILDSGKFKELDSLLDKYYREGKRVLLFSQWTMLLDIIEEYMNIRSYRYSRLDGQTKVGDRLEMIDAFNEDESIFIFLLSTRAGGLGINLTAASVVIIHDIDFNPYNDKQAEDRCHRIGQTKEVIVYRLMSRDTIEEGMLSIADEKLKLGQDISSPNKAKNNDEELVEKSDVKTLLRAALKL